MTRHSRRRVIHGIAVLPGYLVRIVRTNIQRTIPDSALDRHPKRTNVWSNFPGRGTDRSCNPTRRTLVRIVRLVRVFSGRPLSRIPRLSSIFSGQAFHASPAALSTLPGPTAGTFNAFSAFSALFLAPAPPSAGPARTSLDFAKNRPDQGTFRKQNARRHCRSSRITHAACRNPVNRRKWMP
jgi:hypothetical protein